MLSTQLTHGLAPSDRVSSWEFKGCLQRSTCVLMDGSIVTLVASPECKNESITLCAIRGTTREITKLNFPLKEPDKCPFIFAIGNLILVAGENKGYLFNAQLNFQSIIQETFIPGPFVVWDENRFIIAQNYNGDGSGWIRPRLYDVTDPKNPICSTMVADYSIPFEAGTTLFRLMDCLVVSFGIRSIGGFTRDLTIYTLHHLREARSQYTDRSDDWSRSDANDRRIFGLLPDGRFVEINTGDLLAEYAPLNIKAREEILMTIYARNNTKSSESRITLDKTKITWKLPGITHEDEKVLLQGKRDLRNYITDCSTRISIIGYSVLFLRRSEIAVYDLQNNLQYQLHLPLNFRAEGMVVWNNQVVIYNQTSLYQYQFTGLRPGAIKEEIKESIPILPITLIPLIADFLDNDIKLSRHPSTMFAQPALRVIDISEFIPRYAPAKRSKCTVM